MHAFVAMLCAMGCLPVMLLFVAGFGLGYLLGGRAGALWGAGAGLVLGALFGVLLTRMMRGRR